MGTGNRGYCKDLGSGASPFEWELWFRSAGSYGLHVAKFDIDIEWTTYKWGS